jgi:hypothetical protein
MSYFFVVLLLTLAFCRSQDNSTTDTIEIDTVTSSSSDTTSVTAGSAEEWSTNATSPDTDLNITISMLLFLVN